MAANRKSRIKLRIFWSDVVRAFWVGFGTCLVLVLIVVWAVSRGQ